MSLRSLREFFTAYYDPNTNSIVGCERNSFAWYHEKRHEQQYKHKIISYLDYYFFIIPLSIGAALMVLGLFYGMFFQAASILGVGLIPHIILTLILEFDAWVFGTKNYLEYKQHNYDLGGKN